MIKFMTVFVVTVALATGALASGCMPRRHIAKNFGETNKAIYANQKVQPGDTSRSGASIGVDEASAVRAKYVASFSGNADGGGAGAGSGSGAGEAVMQLSGGMGGSSGGAGGTGGGDGNIVLSPE